MFSEETALLIRAAIVYSSAFVIATLLHRWFRRIPAFGWVVIVGLSFRGTQFIAEAYAPNHELVYRALDTGLTLFIVAVLVLLMRFVRQAVGQLNYANEVQQRHAAITRDSNDAIIGLDLEGTVVTWNPAAARMFGFTERLIVGRPATLLVPEDRQAEVERARMSARDGTTTTMDTVRRRRDGSLVDVSITESPVYDHEGHLNGTAQIVRDISARREADREREQHIADLEAVRRTLQESDVEKSEMLAVASHEMRAPLTAISGFSQTLTDLWQTLDDGRKLDLLKSITEQSYRLEQMIGDLLTMSLLDVGKLRPRLEPVSLAKACQRVVETTPSNGMDIEITCTGDEYVHADLRFMDEVLTNLVTNALRYGDSPIHVAGAEDGDGFRLCVEDCGDGVPLEFVPRLFERFAQAPSRRGAASKVGTGLGLSITSSLVAAMHGRVWYEPNHPNGSRFCVWLPRASQS